jgi:hypothetical protein
VIPRLNKINPIIAHDVNETMLLGNPPRPDATPQIFKWFGLAHTAEWIRHDSFNKGKDTERGSPIHLHPIAQIFAKLGLKDRIPLPGWLCKTFIPLRQSQPHSCKNQVFEKKPGF